MSVEIGLVGSTPKLRGTDGAAHVLLYGPDNNPLVLGDKDVIPATQHGIPTVVQNDGVARLSRGDVLGSASIARFKQMFVDLVDGAAVNTQLWTQSLTTMTVTQATRLTTMNAGASVASGTHAIHTSLRQFIKPLGSVLRFTTRWRPEWKAANAVEEAGFGAPVGVTAAVANGAFLRVTSTGTVIAVRSFNNGEQVSGTLAAIGTGPGEVDPDSYYTLDIFINDDSVRYVLQRADDSLAGQIAETPVIDYVLRFAKATIAEWQAISVPVFFRVYNNAATATASRLFYSAVCVSLYDVDAQQPWAEQLAVSGRGGLINPASGAQSANYANSAAPASATLSNTAAGYGALGGQFQFAAVGGAETDYALFGYQVPAGRTLIVRGVKITTWNTVVAVATTPTLMQWGIGRANAVTLAANSFRRAIGSQTFPVGAAVGAMANDVPWTGLHVVDSGQFFHIILKMPIATATATEIFRGVIDVEASFE
jgi:hypothetical protein